MNHIPCVAIIIENSKKEFLLLLRDDKLGLSFANYWTLIGGRVEDGETPEMAAHRELLEETGLKMELFFWKRYNRISPQAPVDQYTYIGKVDEPNPEIDIGEGQDIRFFKPEEIGQLQIAYGFDTLLSEYLSWRSNKKLGVLPSTAR